MTEISKEELTEKTLSLYPDVCGINGPYTRKDGRKIVVLRKKDGGKTSVSFPKLLTEIRMGRRLQENETVDHKDTDFTNDRLENLQILDRKDHSKLDCKRRNPFYTNCTICGEEFEATRDQLRKDKTGFFCSRRCSGLYGALIKNGEMEKVEKEFNTEYHTLKDLGE